MKAQLLIDILSLKPDGEVYIKEWSGRKEITVQIDHVGQIELKTGDVVEDNDEGQLNGGE